MLQGLELADQAAELLALLQVVERALEHLVGDAQQLGRRRRRGRRPARARSAAAPPPRAEQRVAPARARRRSATRAALCASTIAVRSTVHAGACRAAPANSAMPLVGCARADDQQRRPRGRRARSVLLPSSRQPSPRRSARSAMAFAAGAWRCSSTASVPMTSPAAMRGSQCCCCAGAAGRPAAARAATTPLARKGDGAQVAADLLHQHAGLDHAQPERRPCASGTSIAGCSPCSAKARHSGAGEAGRIAAVAQLAQLRDRRVLGAGSRARCRAASLCSSFSSSAIVRPRAVRGCAWR